MADRIFFMTILLSFRLSFWRTNSGSQVWIWFLSELQKRCAHAYMINGEVLMASLRGSRAESVWKSDAPELMHIGGRTGAARLYCAVDAVANAPNTLDMFIASLLYNCDIQPD
jgi:hypothetical protein